jgi:hypothetical protein
MTISDPRPAQQKNKKKISGAFDWAKKRLAREPRRLITDPIDRDTKKNGASGPSSLHPFLWGLRSSVEPLPLSLFSLRLSPSSVSNA